MVAEQIEENTRVGTPTAMDRARSEDGRQPTLAEELDQAEKEARFTKALQAVEKDGMVYDNDSRRVETTPKKTPTMVNTPSPVRVDVDGNTWTIEDSNASDEEHGEHESGKENENQIPSSSDSRACA